ncbi:hypothetical protein ACOZ4L_02835 [Haloplanus ruber]|uniref:Uncharacterized protein n=1 Tax=Haloplanus ruber TaxID=869892 RepID=A0ABD6D149_9EURY|nr:hypothetical protein [Haloplanus ruber]
MDHPDEGEQVLVLGVSAPGAAEIDHVAAEHRPRSGGRRRARCDDTGRDPTLRRSAGLDAELRRRITAFDEIDICEHSDPTDIDEELSE